MEFLVGFLGVFVEEATPTQASMDTIFVKYSENLPAHIIFILAIADSMVWIVRLSGMFTPQVCFLELMRIRTERSRLYIHVESTVLSILNGLDAIRLFQMVGTFLQCQRRQILSVWGGCKMTPKLWTKEKNSHLNLSASANAQKRQEDIKEGRNVTSNLIHACVECHLAEGFQPNVACEFVSRKSSNKGIQHLIVSNSVILTFRRCWIHQFTNSNFRCYCHRP